MNPSDFLAEVRKFTVDELIGREGYLDSFPEPPLPLHRTFHERGMANWWLATEYHGAGLSLRDSVDVVSELAYGDAGAAFTLFASIIGTTLVSLYGTKELSEKVFSRLGPSGGSIATLGSERAAGSELLNISTTAVRHGDTVEISGDKMFSTNAKSADFLVVIAKSAENSLAYLAVVIPKSTPGIRIVKRWETVGMRSAATYQVSFEKCRVPKENILRGSGVQLLEAALNASRVLIAANALGVARRIRDLGMDYAKEKHLHEDTLARNPVFAAKLGQIETQIDVMRNQCLAAAQEFDEIMARDDAAEEFARQGSLRSCLTAKLYCGQTGWQIASIGSEMFGGLGYTHEMIIGKLLRDMRHVSILEGGDDVIRSLIFQRFVVPGFKRI